MGKVLLGLCFVVLIGLPFALHRERVQEGRRLVVITPHVQQIQEEFAHAFSRWHQRHYGEPVFVDYRQPGGTSEIIRQLRAQFLAAAARGRIDPDTLAMEPGTVGEDVMFGGGTYDHGRLKAGISATIDGREVRIPMSVPPDPLFPPEQLREWFGDEPHIVGRTPLYDPEQYWIGTALSSFGIVFNRRRLEDLGLDEPRSFEDLTDPRYQREIALADPRQSGSITTTFESILDNYGWDRGWRILRAMSANTRYFTNRSTKPPLDVAMGEAAAGLAIDFYGRSQSQAVMREGETPQTSRVGYVDPAGSVSIDPDPASIIRGGPDPELARRFLEFLLTEEAQALWQFHARTGPAGAQNPAGESGEPMGPERYELRRMPIRRSLYERYFDSFVDQVRPYEIASSVPSRGWRSSIGIMMGAFGIDSHEELRRAWSAYQRARQDGASDRTREMERLLFAFPEGARVEALWDELFGDAMARDGTPLREKAAPAFQDFTPETYRAVRSTWRDDQVASRLAIIYGRIFRENYGRVVDLARASPVP